MTEPKTLKDLRHKDNKSVMGETYLIREDRLREEAIKWVKKDMEDSIFEPSKILPKPWIDYGATMMPNGKYCRCDPEFTCIFHREGKRVMEMNNITEGDLK